MLDNSISSTIKTLQFLQARNWSVPPHWNVMLWYMHDRVINSRHFRQNIHVICEAIWCADLSKMCTHRPCYEVLRVRQWATLNRKTMQRILWENKKCSSLRKSIKHSKRCLGIWQSRQMIWKRVLED